MFYYLFSSKAANHNHSLSSLHPPPPSTPPICFSLCPSLLHTSLFPLHPVCRGICALGKSQMEKRKNLERKEERVCASLWRSRSESPCRFPLSLFREKSLPSLLTLSFLCFLLSLRLRSSELENPSRVDNTHIPSC